MMIRYCSKCVMPNTKPYLKFDKEGVCEACKRHEQKSGDLGEIDWVQREREFEELVEWARAQDAPTYDAMVPVSGGKDSITQVHRLLGKGLRILAVNVDYGVKTDIGDRNLECIPKMGANLLIFRPNMELHKKLLRIGFEEYGDPDLLSHTLLHAYPLHIALSLGIPLALLGENSAFEYGGPEEIANSKRMTEDWFSRYAENSGVKASAVCAKYSISSAELWQYEYPKHLKQAAIEPVFCSYYFPWDSESHFEIAKKYGFEALKEPREGTYRTYVGIDEMINRVHQYLKVLKLGYGRATDHACEDIRNKRISREDAIELVSEYDLEPLGDDFVINVSEFLGYSKNQFIEIMERYRNKKIWRTNPKGDWYIERDFSMGANF